ncbi:MULTISPECIES: DUF2865 domain-containing protein [Rhodomicrobium]|uniref:DUF2865 domain-containing protein n=1 Tax=Rhodomicrobium TaxID=1068 RepID=UPI000B4BDA2D|nr:MULTISPECIES: DUF2865 domain-containing protein [Rhodomicrobium]
MRSFDMRLLCVSNKISARGAIAGVLWAATFAAAPAVAQQYPQPQQYQQYQPGQQQPQQRGDQRSLRCQDLERQLVSDWQRTSSPQEAVSRIDQELDILQRKRQGAETEADRRECYEDMFIFGRSLKRTQACIALDADIEGFRRSISSLREQRDALTNSANRRIRREDLVAELARNGCGDNYTRENESRRRSNSIFSFWQDDDTSFDRGYANTQPNQTNLPFASYRTMCVRSCDGFYFPISFSTLGSRFAEDEQKCKDQCAAPAQLYVYKNPGEEVEQMVSLSGEPYNNMKNAWRNRKQYVRGCSCKPEEYSQHEIEQSEKELGKQAAAAPRSAQPIPQTQPGADSAGSPKSAQ